MGSKILTFVISLGLWLLLSSSADIQHVLIGVVVSFIVAAGVGHVFAGVPKKWLSFRRYRYFIVYLVVFIREVFKANIDVAYRVLHPDLPINPGIVKIKTDIKSETGLTFLANSITLTPGTLSVDVDGEKGFLYIHWIDVKSRDVEGASAVIAGRFESIIKEVFG
jgi:multicomponent Na+:H+ antiporter subunit E